MISSTEYLYHGRLARANQDTGKMPVLQSPAEILDLTVMEDRLEILAAKAKGLPKAPGVYLMKDDKGRVIYVGKSASLRDRVCSYFQTGTRLEHKKSGLVENIVDFEVLETD